MLEYLLNLDKTLFVLINSRWTTPWADQFFPFITDLHKTALFKILFIPMVLTLFVWTRGFKKGLLIFLFCLMAVGASDGLGNWVFKKNFQRPRPPETQNLVVTVRSPFGGYSFISNHAANMFALASYSTMIFPAVAVPAYTVATLVAYSRVYNGVHFPSDVFVGGLFGIFIGCTFAFLCNKLIKKIQPAGATKS